MIDKTQKGKITYVNFILNYRIINIELRITKKQSNNMKRELLITE